MATEDTNFEKYLRNLSWNDFEDLIGDILEVNGFNIIYKSGIGPDGGCDIMVTKVVENGLESIRKKYLVQCKRVFRNISEKDVFNVRDKIEQWGCDGYLLAVVKGVTSGIVNVIMGINLRGNERCIIWRSNDILNKLIENKELLRKWFPELYKEYFEKISIINTADIISVFEKRFGRNPEPIELDYYKSTINRFSIREAAELAAILSDSYAENKINDIYNRLLNRSSDPVGLIEYGSYFIRNNTLPEILRIRNIEFMVMQSDEYKRIATILYFVPQMNIPFSTVKFDSVAQSFYNWRTYHGDYKNGSLSVTSDPDPNLVQFGSKFIEIQSAPGSEIRLIFMENINAPNKKNIAVDFISVEEFQIFLLVLDENMSPFYIQITLGNGDDNWTSNIHDHNEYLQAYTIVTYNRGPILKGFEFNFDQLTVKWKNTHVARVINIIFAVKGNAKIVNFVMA